MKLDSSLRGQWLYLFNKPAQLNKDLFSEERKKNLQGTSGKYLFFADRKQELITLAEKVMLEYGLYIAKVLFQENKKSSPGFRFVLCIYDYEDRFSKRLGVDYRNSSDVKYRYWKS